MFLFILIIALLNAFFAAISRMQGFYDESYKTGSKSLLLLNISSVLLFALVYILRGQTLFLIFIGLIFLMISFSYLGILRLKNLPEWKPSVVHSFFISVISAISGLTLQQSVIILSIYFITLIILNLFVFRFALSYDKDEKIIELMDLFKVLNGLFFFVLGLVIASDRIKFLKKIANWLF